MASSKRSGNRKRRNSNDTASAVESAGKSKYFITSSEPHVSASEAGIVSNIQTELEDHENAKGCSRVKHHRFDPTFFDTPTLELSKKLLGKHLYRVLDDGEILCGKIVETEAYLGEMDGACHSFGGKRTPRNEPMFMCPGTAYVYFIYGLYHCLNISSREKGACVLIRALEPVKGMTTMRKLRGEKRKDAGTKIKDFQLCNGPSKLCQAMLICKTT